MDFRTVIGQLRRFDGLFSLPQGEDADRLAELSKRKAKTIQFFLIAVVSITIFYCFEVSSQGYSLTGTLYGEIAYSSHFADDPNAHTGSASAVLNEPSASQRPVGLGSGASALKYSVKMFVFCVIAAVLWVQISFNDRLSDNSYLNALLMGKVG